MYIYMCVCVWTQVRTTKNNSVVYAISSRVHGSQLI